MSKEDLSKETEILSNISEYDKAINKFIIEASDKLMVEMDPLLSMAKVERKDTLGKFQTPVNDEWIEANGNEMRLSFTINDSVAKNTNIEEYISIVYDIAKQSAEHIIPQMFSLINEVCEKSGQVINAGGQVFNYDLLLDLLEKMDISFDESGEPIKPTLVMHPDLLQSIKDIKPTPKQEEREKAIWERKKADFLAKKRSRRLL